VNQVYWKFHFDRGASLESGDDTRGTNVLPVIRHSSLSIAGKSIYRANIL